MTDTPNHGYNAPERGTEDWHVPLNENFRDLDADVVVKGQHGERPPDPPAGTWFLATDRRILSHYDGSAWEAVAGVGSGDAPVPGTTHVEALETASVNGVRYVDPADGYGALQDALDDLGSDPGTVFVGPGTIDGIDGNVEVPANTWLRGAGMHSTTLRFADGADPSVAGLIRVTGDDVVVSDLDLDGNRSDVSNDGQEYGLYCAGTSNLTVQRVYCHDFPGYGFDPHSADGRPARNLLITNCLSENNGNDGFTVAGVRNCTVANNVALDNDRHGLNATDVEGERVAFVGNHAAGNGQCGLVVQNSVTRVTAVGCTFRDNERGVRFGSDGGEVAFGTVLGCQIGGNEDYGVHVRGSEHVTVSACAFADNGGRADVAIGDTGTGSGSVVVSNCQFDGSTRYGVEERDGNGPTIVLGNAFDSDVGTPIDLSHADSEATANLT